MLTRGGAKVLHIYSRLNLKLVSGGAVRRMRTRIGLLAQPESLRVLIRLIARK